MALSRTCAVLLLSSALCAQSVWVVDPTGAGHFTSLAAAQTAATAGDTLLIRGTVPAITLTKTLHLIVESGNVFSMLLVRAPEPVSLCGAFNDVTVDGAVVSLSNTTGSLTIRNGGIASARNCVFVPSFFSIGVTIDAGGRGVFDECSFRGRDAYGAFGVVYGTPGLQNAGHAELRNCTLTGGADFLTPNILIPGSAAITLTSDVDLKNCVLNAAASKPLISGAGTVRVENTVTQGAVATLPSVVIVPASLPWTTGTNAQAGGVMHTRVDATPGTLTLTFASLGMHRPFADPFGEYWTDPAGTVVLQIGLTDANGSLTYDAAMPGFAPRGLQLTFQSMLAPSTGGLATSAPAILQIL